MLEISVKSEANTKELSFHCMLLDVKPHIWLPVSQQSRPRGRLDQVHNLSGPLGTIHLHSKTRRKCHLMPAPQVTPLYYNIAFSCSPLSFLSLCQWPSLSQWVTFRNADNSEAESCCPTNEKLRQKTLFFLRLLTLESSLNWLLS